MESTNAPAEFGRSAAGSARFEIKSGSNPIHGSAFEFFLNDVLDARNFFLPCVTAYHGQNGRVVEDRPRRGRPCFTRLPPPPTRHSFTTSPTTPRN
jgi:hypothetical protein